MTMTVSAESEAGEACLPQLPHKSRSLRQSSVAKRLAVESGAGARETKAKIRGVKRLSRYRRKTENAKERERMKKFNQAFENLRQKLPNRELLSEKSISGEKDTKVSCDPLCPPPDLHVAGVRPQVRHLLHQESPVPGG